MMVLENACEFKEYLGILCDEMGLYGSFEMVDNNININIISKDNNDIPTKEQILEKLKEIVLKKKKQELESQILNAFNGVKNKENFIEHLKESKPGSKHRLAYLNLVEPTLKEPDITLIFKDRGKEVKKEHIKVFQGDPKTIYYFLVTQDNDNKLITGLKIKPNYIKAEIDKADIIHSFIPQARTLKEQADGVGLHLKYKTKTLISQGVRRR
ncbi:hypothetical protein VN1281_13850 [Helicobacter pylori]|nr:hypothetical protein VN1281_13850 [Helicobacter pylori]